MIRIDIGIARGKEQCGEWWDGVFTELIRVAQTNPDIEIGKISTAGSAMKDVSKNMAAGKLLGQVNTAENRTAIINGLMAEDNPGEAIFWIDDDTIPPKGALEALIALEADIAAGVYYLRNPPYHPVAYKKHPDHAGYTPLWDFRKGEVRPVDSVGMGCTLVRRYVYEEILKQYVLFSRAATHTLKAVHKDDILETRTLPAKVRKHMGKVLVSEQGAVLLEGLDPVPAVERFPFYVMEFERTEDHYFCEMARRCGFNIMLDTMIECEHWGWKKVTGEHFRKMREQWLAQQKG